MLKDIIRRKIKEKVSEVLEELDIEDILEEAVENALENYDIEDIVTENVESIARDAAIDILDDDCKDMIYNAVASSFDASDY